MSQFKSRDRACRVRKQGEPEKWEANSVKKQGGGPRRQRELLLPLIHQAGGGSQSDRRRRRRRPVQKRDGEERRSLLPPYTHSTLITAPTTTQRPRPYTAQAWGIEGEGGIVADQDGRTYRREEEGATHKSIRPGRTVRSPSSMGFFHTKRMGSTPHT